MFEEFHPESGSVTLSFEDGESTVDKQPLFKAAVLMNTEMPNLKSFKAVLNKVTSTDWKSINVLTSPVGVTATEIFGREVHYEKIIKDLHEKQKIRNLRYVCTTYRA